MENIYYVCLSLYYCVSIFTRPTLQTDTIMASIRTEGLRFISGRTQGTRNVVHEGYQYGSPNQLVSWQTSWGCIRKDCVGWIHTLGDTQVHIKKEHNHESDLSLCNAKLAVSKAKDQAEFSRTGAAVIIATSTAPLSMAERARLPNGPAVKKQL